MPQLERRFVVVPPHRLNRHAVSNPRIAVVGVEQRQRGAQIGFALRGVRTHGADIGEPVFAIFDRAHPIGSGPAKLAQQIDEAAPRRDVAHIAAAVGHYIARNGEPSAARIAFGADVLATGQVPHGLPGRAIGFEVHECLKARATRRALDIGALACVPPFATMLAHFVGRSARGAFGPRTVHVQAGPAVA